MTNRTYRLGNLQLKILKFLWDREAASVADVHDAVGERAGLAYTTVATMLRKMEARGLVKHRGEGRRFIYQAAVKPDAVSRNGTTVVDMANGPRQRLQPYPETVALLEMLGAANSHKCVSC